MKIQNVYYNKATLKIVLPSTGHNRNYFFFLNCNLEGRQIGEKDSFYCLSFINKERKKERKNR